jgi:hypothetical protein
VVETKFDPEQKSSKILLEIMTLVSSGNNIGSDMEFITGKKSFIYIYIYIIMNNGVPRIDPRGTLCFSASQSEKKL